MDCRRCGREEEECKKYVVSGRVICRICEMCRQCAKGNTKICKECCEECERCEKRMLKNNWPIDIIVHGLCDKCNHLCYKCEKYIEHEKAIYKEEKEKYCQQCFEDKYMPIVSKGKEEELYVAVVQKQEEGQEFIRWKKTHEGAICEICGEEYLKNVRQRVNKCNKCNRKKGQRRMKNPSDANNRYKQDEKGEWKKAEKRKKCIRCYNSIWMRVENVETEDNKYYCPHCSPSVEDEKYKYDKKKQRWVMYKKRIECKKCGVKKWLLGKNMREEICIKCERKK